MSKLNDETLVTHWFVKAVTKTVTSTDIRYDIVLLQSRRQPESDARFGGPGGNAIIPASFILTHPLGEHRFSTIVPAAGKWYEDRLGTDLVVTHQSI